MALEKNGVTIEDDSGRKVVIPAAPQRIVSLAPSSTEILFAMGLGDRVVGVTDHDNYPAQVLELPKVGGYAMPNLEVLLALEPELVFADSIHEETVNKLEQLGLPGLVFDPVSVDDVYRIIVIIGNATGEAEAAEELVNEMKSKVAEIIAPLANLPSAKKPSVYYEAWYDPMVTAGPKTFVHDLITIAGGENIAANAQKAWPEYSMEVLLTQNPEVIIIPSDGHGGEATTVEDVMLRPGWSEISAVKNGKIFVVTDDFVSRPGPRLVQGIEQMVHFLHPDLPFKD